MKCTIFCSFIFICILCPSILLAEDTKPVILFEVDSVFIETRPGEPNDIIKIFAESTDFNSATIESIENVNRKNIFGKDDLDVGYRIYFEFFVEIPGQWEFDMCYDAGVASMLIIDQNVIMFCNVEIWKKSLIKKVELEKGWHSFEFFALESCCGDPMTFKVKTPISEKFEIISVKTMLLSDLQQEP